VGARYFRLPRFATLLSDGSIYSVLEAKDRVLLLAAPAPGRDHSAPGILQTFLDAGPELDRRIAQYGPEYHLYNAASNDLRAARAMQEPNLRQFQGYLQSLGILSTALPSQ
jgi:hypothetical protein